MATALKVKEIHSGVIHKVGGRVKSWNKRWMVLSTDHMLHYYKDASKPSLGAISINDPVFSIRKGEPNDIAWPKQCRVENTLVITTSGRTYFMFAESTSEAEKWMSTITNTRGELDGNNVSSTTLPDRYNKMGGRAAHLSAPSALPSEPRKTPKQYKKKDRRLPTKRFSSTGDYDTGPDSDDNEGMGLSSDGQLSRELLPQSLPTITHSVEGIYDLVSSMDNNNDTLSSPTQTLSATTLSPPTSGRVRNSSDVSFEVGRINAGEDIEQQELYEPVNEQLQQELYEPIDNPDSKSPPPSNTPKLPPPPPLPYANTQDQLYESISEPHPQTDNAPIGVMYEDVERSNDLKEADSSDDDDTIPLPSNLLPPPPLPPRVGEEMYDNAPSLPTKGAKLEVGGGGDESYYGNVGNSPSPRRPPSSNQVRQGELKAPKPLPRTNIGPTQSNSPPLPTNNNSLSVNNNDTVEDPDQELYDDIQVVLERKTEEGEQEKERREGINGNGPHHTEEEEEDGRDVVADIIPRSNGHTPSHNNADSTLYILRSPSPGGGEKRRVHSATVGANDTGIEMFYRKAKELTCDTEENSIKKHVRDLFLAEKKQAIMSSEDKVVLAETLREIETEKQLASEEKFKWERERLKFEEDRKQFEREKQRLLEELAKTKAQLETQK